MMKSDELLDKMSAIADLAITCEAKVETFESRPHTETRVDEADKCKTIHAYAAKIALAALEKAINEVNAKHGVTEKVEVVPCEVVQICANGRHKDVVLIDKGEI